MSPLRGLAFIPFEYNYHIVATMWLIILKFVECYIYLIEHTTVSSFAEVTADR